MQNAARSSAVLALGLLAACVPGDPIQTTSARPLGYDLRSTGLGVPGSPLEVSFDRVNPGAEIALTKLTGPFPTPQTALCQGSSARVYVFDDGLSLFFNGRTFVRWQKAGSGAGTQTCTPA